MRTIDIENVNVAAFDTMPTPEEIHARLPISAKATKTVTHGRGLLRKILERKDQRLFVVVGPCSIHDPVAGLDYARRLKALADEVGDTLQLIMRVYFEKPRTTVGWKGYINDPFMDDSFRVDIGMEKARQFLLDVAELGLPTGTEALDPISPQYFGDLITWTAIGARTAESQTHREMSSGLIDTGRLQERHQRRPRRRGQRHPVRLQAALLPRHQQPGPRRGRPHQGQPLRPHRPARRRRPPELRHGFRGHGRAGADQGQAAQHHRRRLLARQQLQETGTAAAGASPTSSTRSASATNRWSAS